MVSKSAQLIVAWLHVLGQSIMVQESVCLSAFLLFKRFIYLFYVCEHTITVFRHTRSEHLTLFQMVMNQHVVAGTRTQDLEELSVHFTGAPNLQPGKYLLSQHLKDRWISWEF